MLVTHRKKEQTFQVNDFSAVLFMGRCKRLGSVKLFLFVHPNTVEPVSPFFLHPEFPQSTALGAAAVADGCGEQHSLFTRMAGNSVQSTPQSPLQSDSLLLWVAPQDSPGGASPGLMPLLPKPWLDSDEDFSFTLCWPQNAATRAQTLPVAQREG